MWHPYKALVTMPRQIFLLETWSKWYLSRLSKDVDPETDIEFNEPVSNLLKM